MKAKKIISILLVISIIMSFANLFTTSSFAATAGSQSATVENYGDYTASHAKLHFRNASFASGNNVTYLVDRYSCDNLSNLGNIYSVTYSMNGFYVKINTSISNSDYALSETMNMENYNQSKVNNILTNTVDGKIIGEVPEVGESVSFSVTASINVSYNYSGYAIGSSTSSTINVTFIGVDTTELRREIEGTFELKESCWTTDSWSAYTEAMNNAKSVSEDATAYQSDINSALENLRNKKAALSHIGEQKYCEYCANPETGEITPVVFNDVVYGNDRVRQSLDVCLPINAKGEIGLVVKIHGGAWIAGDKGTDNNLIIEETVKYNVACAKINYRYTAIGSVSASEILDDITAALAKIKSLAHQKGLNITRVMLMGGSAGGHLSMLYAYSRMNEAPIKPVCVFSQSGPTYLYNDTYIYGNSLGTETEMAVLMSAISGTVFTPDTRALAYDALMKASPVNYVTQDTVPTVICHGKYDTIVDYSDAQYLDYLLTEKGVTHTFITYPNSGHGLNDSRDLYFADYANQMYDSYIRTYLLQNHTHSYTLTSTTNATCDKEGVKTFTCDCGSEITETIPTVDHTPGEWVVSTPPTVNNEGMEFLYCSVCQNIINQRSIPALTYVLEAAEDKSTVIDNENLFIYGLEEGLSSLDEFVNFEGCTLVYNETKNGFGTGTTVDIMVDGEKVATYTIVIFGDVTGDGFVDAFDVSMINAVANFETQYPQGSAYEMAADVSKDGYIDAIDLSVALSAANYENEISQVK